MDRSRKDCIVLQNEELLRTSKFTNVSGTQDAFDIVKAVGFVMSDLEWAPFVLLAARSVLGQPHGQPKPAELPPSRPGSGLDPIEITIVERMILDLKGVLRRAGVPRAKFDPVIEAATRAGYFDAAPLFSRPVDAQSAPVKAIADRLAAFDGQRSWQVRPETVAAFVNQLPPKLREPMLARLNEVELLDEQVIAESLLSQLSGLGEVDVVPMSPSSGNSARTALLREQSRTNSASPVRVRSHLAEALQSDDGRQIVLIDDNAASGVQSRAQFLRWSGRDRSTWPIECQEEENLFDPIDAAQWKQFQARPVRIVVCAGRALASERLTVCLSDLGFTNFAGLFYSRQIGAVDQWADELRDYLTGVGRSVLTWSRRDKTQTEAGRKFCVDNAFGYGAAGGLLITTTNVPSSTVTALWCPGIHNQSPWMPLVIRQNKLRHLVLA
jgi:hypothetical protein